VKANGLNSIAADRMERVLTEVSSALEIPKPAAAESLTPAYLPSQDELKIAK